ncbi:MAG: FtsH protease activity modulator HflK [Rhodospirillaceae bacterium]|nr:FtsH protease activity modulator HflK [Rhodospirillaceae bacterium]
MPWTNQGGNGGGPWGSGGNDQNPWGGPPGRGPGGNSGGPTGPSFEDMIRRGQDRMRQLIPGGFGGKRAIVLGVVALLAIWMATGLFRVQPGEQGVIMTFGAFTRTVGSGLHYHLPGPIQSVEIVNTEQDRLLDIGFIRGNSPSGGAATAVVQRDVPQESLMLTGDENIIDIDFTVRWRISNAENYLFRLRNQEDTVRAVAESVMREIIGQSDLQSALTRSRSEIEQDVRDGIRRILADYESGISVTSVQLLNVSPPPQVIDAFNDVIRAQADRETQVNQGRRYFAEVREQSRGEAARMLQDAEAYQERVINEAEGQAQRFLYVLSSYSQNPSVTAQRMYVETLQDVLTNANVVMIDSGQAGGTGGDVVQYLPLNELLPRPGAAAPANDNQ